MQADPRKKLVVIDDEEYIGKIIAESLGDKDYALSVFKDPGLALEHIGNNPVDLVLSDILMGSHSGGEVLDTTLENHPDAIVIMMTAHPTIQTAIQVLRKGAYDFLVKPFKLEMLSATIKRGVGHQKVLRENLALKSQVEFLKVTNSYFTGGQDLEQYFELVLKSCNTELSARASAVIEFNPGTDEIVRQVYQVESEADLPFVLDAGQYKRCNLTGSKPFVKSFEIHPEGKNLWRVLVCQPIVIRKKLHGVINVMVVSRSDQIAPGRLDILSILASSTGAAIANQNLYQDLQTSYLQAIRALANSIEARDVYTAGHTDRVSKLAEALARSLGWDEHRILQLNMGCTLHDIGKIGIPDAILNKAERLTDEERNKMIKHPQTGLKIIRGIDLFKPSIPYILHHHERYDGKGYPKGLKGKEIPIEGRLLAVADTFDAILSDRPYRPGAPLNVAISELLNNKGTQFDPELVDTFVMILKRREIDLRTIYDREIDMTYLDEIDLPEITSEKVLV